MKNVAIVLVALGLVACTGEVDDSETKTAPVVVAPEEGDVTAKNNPAYEVAGDDASKVLDNPAYEVAGGAHDNPMF